MLGDGLAALTRYTLTEWLLIAGTIVLMAILLCEVFDFNTWVFASGTSNTAQPIISHNFQPMHMQSSIQHSANVLHQLKPNHCYSGAIINYGYDDDNGN